MEIDVLWLIEHTAREMDVACAVKYLAEKRYGLNIDIKHVYFHANEVMRKYRPMVVALPFFYNSKDLAIKDFVRRWPNCVFFNLAWEEIFYKGHEKIKAPSDYFARHKVIHHTWGEFYKKYLTKHGVMEENIFINGNPAYELYISPYKQFYKNRDWLSEKYFLEKNKKWILIPENYRWAFISDRAIQRRGRQGADENELLEMREFARKSLCRLMRWCNQAAKNSELQIIFRPKPATMLKDMEIFFSENIQEKKSDCLYFIKSESVREWILSCDVIISSFSTTLIEAAIADKPAYMAEPYPLSDSFFAEWYKFVPRLKDYKEFEQACLSGLNEKSNGLKSWAKGEMLSNGDPISSLADFLNKLVKQQKQKNTPNLLKISEFYYAAKFKIGRKKKYFNFTTHENDIFNDDDVNLKTEQWLHTLSSPKPFNLHDSEQ